MDRHKFDSQRPSQKKNSMLLHKVLYTNKVTFRSWNHLLRNCAVINRKSHFQHSVYLWHRLKNLSKLNTMSKTHEWKRYNQHLKIFKDHLTCPQLLNTAARPSSVTWITKQIHITLMQINSSSLESLKKHYNKLTLWSMSETYTVLLILSSLWAFETLPLNLLLPWL